MKNSALILAIMGVSLSGCNPTSTPLIDMCQKITQNLVGTVSEWQEPQKSANDKYTTVQLAYSTEGGQSGTATCKHPMEMDGRDATGTYRVAPETMALNGAPVSSGDLVSASIGATKQIVKDTAVNTKEKSIELANDASDKAKELADQAQVMAEEARVKAAEMAVKAEAMAGDAQVKAKELAEQAKIKAAELASQASDLSSVAKEKAREAALEATKTVQDKLSK